MSEESLVPKSYLSFDGIDDFVALPAMNIDWSQGLTVEAWVRYEKFNVFSRIIDMFEFFRTKPRSLHADQLYINLGYWAEKVLAQDRHGKIEEYVPEVAKRKLLRHLRYDVEDKAQRREIYDAVSRYLDDSEHEAREALSEHIDDTWEWNLSDYTSTFTWCCYALSWGIRQYDQAKALQGETVEVAR